MTRIPTPRQYGLLGDDRTWPLCAAIGSSNRHVLATRQPLDDHVSSTDRWRLLIEDTAVEAVLADADDSVLLESARQLVMRGKPLVVRAGAALPADFVTEMSLYDGEGSSTLAPWFEHRLYWDPLLKWLDETPYGVVTSVQIECSLTDEAELRSNVFLTDRLMADIDLLRMIGGDYSQVTLLRTGGGDGSFNTQTLQLSGPGLPDAACVYRRAAKSGGRRLRIDGTDTYAEAVFGDGEAVWHVGGEEVDRQRFFERGDDESATHQERLLTQLDGLWQQTDRSASWNDLVRIFDIAEAMRRSLRRRRTIDLHFETTSERSQFKTHMAAVGCGVILWTMFGMIGLLFAGAVLDPRGTPQVQAESAGFVLRGDEFEAATGELTPTGKEHVRQIAKDIGLSGSVVIVAASESALGSGLHQIDDIAEIRRRAVGEALAEAGAAGFEQRIVTRPLKGEWFAQAMLWGRVLVFGPVGLFLLLQVLLMIAKPAAKRESVEE